MKNDLTRIEVLAQYYDENGKPKGGQKFFFYADSDLFMYTPKELIEQAIQEMLDIEAPKSYKYVSHDLVFFEPIELKTDFEIAMLLNKDLSDER